MTDRPLLVLVSLTLTFAAWLVTHLWLVKRGWRGTHGPLRRLGLLLPPAAPIVAWRTEARVLVPLWGALVAAYVLLLVAARYSA
jgi:hypothetical protein